MSRHDHAQQELDHIEAVISQLEHLGVSHRTEHSSAVMHVEYWRTRIRTVLALPDVPRRVVEQGSALLARLDRLHPAPRDTTMHDRK
ncbi:hypothetical protein B0G76_1125 [Paraburkholderia sp. BL23I1N1]|nr:hypothetical protein B0G76_8237 [Paraburkholderia sp. BL23I1N1]RKE35077.1 hypothetical protein B0G76_1125 [Paraburkholderia sp. BL23I1N1]